MTPQGLNSQLRQKAKVQQGGLVGRQNRAAGTQQSGCRGRSEASRFGAEIGCAPSGKRCSMTEAESKSEIPEKTSPHQTFNEA